MNRRRPPPSAFDRDRAHGAGLPVALGPDSYARIGQHLQRKQAQREAFLASQVDPTVAEVESSPEWPQRGRTTRTASVRPPEAPATRRKVFASVADVESAGFRRVASGVYTAHRKTGHEIWELRSADGGGYHLVRKREERAVDLREAHAMAADEARARFARRAQVEPSFAAEEELAPIDEDLAALPSGDPAEVDEDDYLHDTAQEIVDMHEVMHGREPAVVTPMVEAVEEAVEEDEDPEFEPDDEDPEGDLFDEDYGDLDEDGDEGADEDDEESESDAPFQAAAARHLIGRRVVALNDGEIAEGIVITIKPMGDMDVDFDGDVAEVPFDMVLDPELAACPFCGSEECECSDLVEVEVEDEDQDEDHDDE